MGETEIAVDEESADPLWRVSVYRLSLELLEAAKKDASVMLQHPLSKSLADQLYRSVCSIGANLAEGYSRSSGRDRVRFLEYALGSARECRHWYRAALVSLPRDHVAPQQRLLNRICQLIMTMIPPERARLIRKEQKDQRSDASPD